MSVKICFKCQESKPLTEYYKHPKMGDGHLNKCKDCTKRDSVKTYKAKITDPEWYKKEKARHRDKYYRLGYKEKHKPSSEDKKEAMQKYWDKYPEKKKAHIVSQRIQNINGHNHHWSYNDEHFKDVIDLTSALHAKLHRYIIYDQERKMYRRYDNNTLLDTRQLHEMFIEEIKNLD